MVSVKVKIYSALTKFSLRRRLQTLIENQEKEVNQSDVVSRPGGEPLAPAVPIFSDGVATRDIHMDSVTSLCVRIFLPESALGPTRGKVNGNNNINNGDGAAYGGYSPVKFNNCKKLPVVLQFHGGGWVSGGVDTVSNDAFCRRTAKMCDAVVVSVGYRLAPESRFPAAFEDGLAVLNWLGKQAILAECNESMGLENGRFFGGGGGDGRRLEIVDGFGSVMVEPWLAAHADPSRCVLLGASCGANIANYVAQRAVEAGNLLDPVRVVAQILMYPFFIGSATLPSEIRLANAYLYDKATSVLAWKLFLPVEGFDLDHPAANPLTTPREVPLRLMPPTLTVVAEHDWMRDRAIAYSQELRKVNVDAPIFHYKDAVHDFATLEMLLDTPQSLACSEDVSIWVKKYISQRGQEFSY